MPAVGVSRTLSLSSAEWVRAMMRSQRFEDGDMSIRPAKRIIQSTPTLEGAGVRLRRAFGFGNTSDFDPFLLLDDFRNENPSDYSAGFPWHPHRGIETIPTCSPVASTMATVSGIEAVLAPATSSG